MKLESDYFLLFLPDKLKIQMDAALSKCCLEIVPIWKFIKYTLALVIYFIFFILDNQSMNNRFLII